MMVGGEGVVSGTQAGEVELAAYPVFPKINEHSGIVLEVGSVCNPKGPPLSEPLHPARFPIFQELHSLPRQYWLGTKCSNTRA